jgi:hypothetical protein
MGMMYIDPYFPCKTCGHKAWEHYISIGRGKAICLNCFLEAANKGPTSNFKADHEFVGDNLKYLASKEALDIKK